MKKQFLISVLFVFTALAITTSSFAQLPDPGFEIDEYTAIVITDPQNDFLSPDGVMWGVVGQSVTENNTVASIETLFILGVKYDIKVLISPHYYYAHDRT